MLHDICDEHGDNFTEEHPDRTVNIQPPVQALSEHANTEGADIRDALMMHFNRGTSDSLNCFILHQCHICYTAICV